MRHNRTVSDRRRERWCHTKVVNTVLPNPITGFVSSVGGVEKGTGKRKKNRVKSVCNIAWHQRVFASTMEQWNPYATLFPSTYDIIGLVESAAYSSHSFRAKLARVAISDLAYWATDLWDNRRTPVLSPRENGQYVGPQFTVGARMQFAATPELISAINLSLVSFRVCFESTLSAKSYEFSILVLRIS